MSLIIYILINSVMNLSSSQVLKITYQGNFYVGMIAQEFFINDDMVVFKETNSTYTNTTVWHKNSDKVTTYVDSDKIKNKFEYEGGFSKVYGEIEHTIENTEDEIEIDGIKGVKSIVTDIQREKVYEFYMSEIELDAEFIHPFNYHFNSLKGIPIYINNGGIEWTISKIEFISIEDEIFNFENMENFKDYDKEKVDDLLIKFLGKTSDDLKKQ